MTFSIMAFTIMIFSKITLSVMPFNMTTFSRITFSITMSDFGNHHNDNSPSNLSVVMLSVLASFSFTSNLK